MIEISVQRGLMELKLLKDRITKQIGELKPLGLVQKGAKDISGQTVEAFKKSTVEAYQSLNDLTTRRENIKKAIVESNAKTFVVVGGKNMTVAEAITKKDSLPERENLLSGLKQAQATFTSTLAHKNESVDDEVDRAVNQSLANKTSKADEKALEAIKSAYENKYWELVDPLDINKVIAELEKEIITFKQEVDIVLSESNALTKINI